MRSGKGGATTIKRISFIEAGASGSQMLNRFAVARVGTVLLATILKEKGHEVRAFIEDLAGLDWEYIESSDVVCISTLTPTANRAYKIGKRLRAKGIPIIMGGVHPTFLPEEALRYSDYVIKGEADYSLPDLVSHLNTGTPPLHEIAGLSYKSSGEFIHNPPGRLLEERELDKLPDPDFSLVRNWKAATIYPLSTSRGCPFACTFCSVVPMFGRKYRFKSVGAVLRELKKAQGVSSATRFFVDDNFTANKGRTKELLSGMIADGLTWAWSAQVRTDVARDRDLLRLMADSGCHTLYIGFESINPKTLKAYNKRQALEDIVNCVRSLKDHGIHIHGMFVLGADTDDVDTIRRTADFAINVGIDTVQFAMLTPLPGTPVFDEIKESGRLLHTDWSKYNIQNVVFRPALMPPEMLQVETLKGMGRFYSWKYILKRLMRFDFHYAAVGLYGKRLVNRALSGY